MKIYNCAELRGNRRTGTMTKGIEKRVEESLSKNLWWMPVSICCIRAIQKCFIHYAEH